MYMWVRQQRFAVHEESVIGQVQGPHRQADGAALEVLLVGSTTPTTQGAGLVQRIAV